MDWYHITVLVFGAGGPRDCCCFHCRWFQQRNLVLVFLPMAGVEMTFKVPPNAKHSIIPWLSCLRPGVCWRFCTLPHCVTRAEFSRCLFWWSSKLQSECWGFCRADVQFSQWQKLVFVWSERLDFDGVGVSGLTLARNNVKIQPSIPWVPLENVNAFRPQRTWGRKSCSSEIVVCLAGRPRLCGAEPGGLQSAFPVSVLGFLAEHLTLILNFLEVLTPSLVKDGRAAGELDMVTCMWHLQLAGDKYLKELEKWEELVNLMDVGGYDGRSSMILIIFILFYNFSVVQQYKDSKVSAE